MSTENPSGGIKQEIAVQPEGSGPSDSQAVNKALPVSGSKHEQYTDEFVEYQIAEGWPDLDNQERAWADEFVINGFNHREAAVEVGLPAKKGIHLTRKPLLRRYISYIQQKMSVGTIVTKEFIDAHLQELYERAIGEVAVPLVTGDGRPFEANKYDGNLAIKILQERGKLAGVVEDDSNSGHTTNVIIDVGALVGNHEKVVK